MFKTTLPVGGNFPSLAVFNGRLYLAVRGENSRILLASSADGFHFDGPTELPWIGVRDPALAVFGGRLHLARIGLDETVHVASSADGVLFENDVSMATYSITGPVLAPLGDRLHLSWTDRTDHSLHFASTADATTYRADAATAFPSAVTPALAAHGGRLFTSWLGGGGRILLASSLDGCTFGDFYSLPWRTPFRVSLGILFKRLYLAFMGTAGVLQVAASEDGVEFAAPSPLGELGMHPALAEFLGRLYIAWEWPEGDVHVAHL